MPKLSLNASKKTKHTPAGEIPVDWGCAEVGHVAKVITGSTPSGDTALNYGGKIPFITPGDLSNSTWIRATERTLTEQGLRGSRRVPAGSTVVVCIGSSIGKVGITTTDSGANQQLNAATAGSEVDSNFLYYALDSSMEKLARLTGYQAVPIVNKSEFSKIHLPLPPLPEQRKIAGILSTWDEALETLDAHIAAKDRQKQALMQQLLTGKTRVKGAKGKWRKVRMTDVLERVFRPIDWHADLPLNLVSIRRRCGGLFRRPSVKGSEYKTQDLHEIRAGDFLISKRQVVHGAWGYVNHEFEGGHVSKEYAILDNRAPDKLHMPFFSWLAQTRRLIRLARISSTGVHIEKLIFDPDVFLRESIRIPADIDEQQQIAAILDTADQELTLLRAQRTAIDRQKRGLMQRLLTGKLRVKIQ